MTTPPTTPQNVMTEADLDRALQTESDSILPSSGFADSVMAAITHEATVPAPIPFPWKRALPGLAAVVAAVVLLIAATASVLHSPASFVRAMPALSDGQSLLHSLTHHGNDAIWIAAAFAIPFACLFLCRKLILPR